MKDILAMQSDVAQRVVRALQVQLGVDEARALTKKPTENAEAYRLYLLGRYHFNRFTRAGWTNAIHYFQQALQVDPNYALAYCGLADTYGWAGGQILPGREAWAKEKELALKALALDPDLADAHVSMGVALFSLLDFHRSENELKRAIELNPNLALAYDQYGWTFMTKELCNSARHWNWMRTTPWLGRHLAGVCSGKAKRSRLWPSFNKPRIWTICHGIRVLSATLTPPRVTVPKQSRYFATWTSWRKSNMSRLRPERRST